MTFLSKSLLLCLIIVLFSSDHINCRRIKITKQDKLESHIHDKNHDASLDHEKFLGKEEAKQYDTLSSEESVKRLKDLVVQRVDKDRDGYITESELKQWINYVSTRTKEKEVEDSFNLYANKSEDSISREKYFASTYGGHKEEALDEESRLNLKKMVMQDERKWQLADSNHDNRLNLEEFANFLHPEDHPVLQTLVIDEALEISDKDNDGKFNLQEYLNDLYPVSDRTDDSKISEWIQMETETFREHRDLNKDGYLDREEIQEWLLPANYDSADAETQHLIALADTDKDGRISMDEVENHHDLFAGSQATQYGETLKNGHEEL